MFNRRELYQYCVGATAPVWPFLALTLQGASPLRRAQTARVDSLEVLPLLKHVDEPADRVAISQYVATFGGDWLSSPAGTLQQRVDSYADYTARALGIDPPGEWTHELVQLALSTPRCSCPDSLHTTAKQVAGGPSLAGNPVEWYVEAVATNVAKWDWHQWLTQAWDSWAAVCGLNHRQTATRDAARCIHSIGRGRPAGFDGPSGVLAWAQLPPTARYKGQLVNRYDDQEEWSDEGGAGKILAQAVMAHEIGHLLGLGHTTAAGALMLPHYSPLRPCPAAPDIARVVVLYGDRKGAPPESPPDPIPEPLPPKSGGPCKPADPKPSPAPAAVKKAAKGKPKIVVD